MHTSIVVRAETVELWWRVPPVILVMLLVTSLLLFVALSGARGWLGSVGSMVLLGAPGAIDKFAIAAGATAEVPAEWVVPAGLREPTTQAGVLDPSALATVLECAAVHWAFDFVDHVEELTEVAGGQVVAYALDNVQDLVVGDAAVVVGVGLLVEGGKGLLE